MFYTKVKHNGKTTKIVINDKSVYTVCPECQCEHRVDLADMLEDEDFCLYSSRIYCERCSRLKSAGQGER